MSNTSISMEAAGFGFHNDVYTYITKVVVKGLPDDTLSVQHKMTQFIEGLLEKRILLSDDLATKITGGVMPGLDNSSGSIKTAVLGFVEQRDSGTVDADETGLLTPVRDAVKKFGASASIVRSRMF